MVRDEIRGLAGSPPPDLLVLVLDASNLARNLFFALQLLDAGIPAVAALNCVDAAAAEGITVDARALSRLLGVPVVRPAVTETTALGAAYAAGWAVGFWKDADELRSNWRADKIWQPRMAPADRDRLHRRWLDAVERSFGWEGGGPAGPAA